jgi:hypothetical protein
MAKRWASDEDAERLLAGILEDTEGQAKAEADRTDAERLAKEERAAQLQQMLDDADSVLGE